MHEILFQYHRVHPTTWVYLSSLLTIALYFKFSRFWAMRNFDLVGLMLLSPGLLIVDYGAEHHSAFAEQLGYTWLFATSGLFLFRLLGDPLMVRRPLLEPNLSVGGQTFLGVSLLVFLMANVVTTPVANSDLQAAERASELFLHQESGVADESLATYGPGFSLLLLIPSIPTHSIIEEEVNSTPQDANHSTRETNRTGVNTATARTMAILSHLAIVMALVLIGYRHFDNIKTGIAAATLYLLLPYTAQWTGHVYHVLPAALLIWAVESYRRPMVAGMLMGLAIGMIYFPAFLLPLWIGFYWQRGRLRFIAGVVLTLGLLVGSLALTSRDMGMFVAQAKLMFGWRAPLLEDLGGFWKYHVGVYRMPVLTAFAGLCASFAMWPAQKNLGTLMSCTAVVMLGVQFWHPYGGGLFMAWYLPVLLLTIFRPNLEDRVALSVVDPGWLAQRRLRRQATQQAN